MKAGRPRERGERSDSWLSPDLPPRRMAFATMLVMITPHPVGRLDLSQRQIPANCWMPMPNSIEILDDLIAIPTVSRTAIWP